MPEPHSTNFVPSSKPPVSEIVKPSMSEAVKSVEVTPSRKIRVNLQESKPKTPNPPKGKLHDKPAWVCHFCGKSGHIRPNCFKYTLCSFCACATLFRAQNLTICTKVFMID